MCLGFLVNGLECIQAFQLEFLHRDCLGSLSKWWPGQREHLPPEFYLKNATRKFETSRNFKTFRDQKRSLKKDEESIRPYPRTNLMISPGWRISPTSSQTDTVIEPVLSATRHARTTWSSLVLVPLPKRNSRIIDREFVIRKNRERVKG